MKSNLLVLAGLGLLTVACGGGAETAQTTDTTADAETAAVTDGGDAVAASGEMAAAPAPAGEMTADAGDGTSANVAIGPVTPGGAIDVLQREGWRITPIDNTPA